MTRKLSDMGRRQLSGAFRYIKQEAGMSISKLDLFMAYKSWAEDNGIRYCMSNKQLSRKLKDRGFHEHPSRHLADCRLHTTGATISLRKD